MKFYFLSCLLIVFISFIILFPSFNLSFEDEDWRGVVIPRMEKEYVDGRLSAYSSPAWFMGTFYTWFGPNFPAYFYLAFIFRNLLAFTIILFVYFVTKDRLASFLGGLFMAVSFTGIQNTYEVMNMIVYLSMAGLVIFLMAFFKTFNQLSAKHMVIMGIALILATGIASFRVYPVYVWAFIIDSSRLFLNFKKDKIKTFLARQAVILIVFLFLYQIGIFSWYTIGTSPGQGSGDFSRFISDIGNLLISLNPAIASTYLKGLGNILLPDILDKSGTASLFLGVVLILIFIGALIYGIKRKTRDIHLLLYFLIWPLLFYTLYFLIYVNGDHLKSPPLPSTMRYLLPPFIGFNIALAIFIAFTRKNKFKNTILGSVVILILVHAVSTYSFLSQLSKLRDGPFMMKIWKQIPNLVPQPALSAQKLNVFYFETDSPRALYTVNDGFIGHTIALYKFDDKAAKFDPVKINAFGRLIAPPIISFEELVSYVKKSLAKDPEPDIWDRIFALKVEGEKVSDIKDDVKKRVETSLNQ